MVRRYNGNTCIMIETDSFSWLVVLERLHNTPSGAPRFKANLCILKEKELNYSFSENCSIVYTFNGHYDSDKNEALFIVNYHEDYMRKKVYCN